MRNSLLAAAAGFVVAVSAPAAARDGSAYIGIEGGLLFPKDNDADVFADFTTTNAPNVAGLPPGPADTNFEDAFGLEYKRGLELDVIAGYDFGMFRLEAELAGKRASLDELDVDADFINALNTALNLNQAGGGAPLAAGEFEVDGKVRVLSLMANALLDFGNEGVGAYAGVGFGRARVKMLGDKDSGWATQFIAGVRTAISNNVDIGLKYRFFRSHKLDFADDDAFAVGGDPRTIIVNGVPVAQQVTNVVLGTDFEDRFRSHSLLASLIFNFGSPVAALPAPPPPPPPVVAPATQTCPDGSVVLATDVCPLPPPPPPPPAGERG